MAVHDGHRDRMREKIQSGGVELLNDHEILEFLLFTFIPRKDTNEIAHNLLAQFENLEGVFTADYERLAEVNGMTQNAALFLSMMPEVFRRYVKTNQAKRKHLQGKGEIRDYLFAKFYGAKKEMFYVLALDAHEQVIKGDNIKGDSADNVQVSVRRVVDFALKNRATSILIAHNHPSGNLEPSQNDFAITRDIAWTLDSVGISLLDHYIFNASEYYSFEEDGVLKNIYKEKDLSLKDGVIFYERYSKN